MTTTNLSNPNSIIPFVQGGNRMRFEMESSEPVMLSSVIMEDNFVGYGDKVVASGCNFTEVQFQAESTNSICNASWQSSNVQVMEASLNVSAGKIYYPTFYAEDYAGNVMKVKNTDTTVNYSTTPRGKSTDYRLFVDTVFPDATGIDTTNWADGKDGVIADGVTPENDRLVSNATRYIIRGNQLTLKVKAEKNTRAILQTSGSFTTLNPTSTNCTTGTDTSSNGVIVKFGSKCDLSFVYNWTGTGGQNDLGEASDYKNFSVSLVDLAGNASIESSPVAVYNDRTAAKVPEISLKLNNKPINKITNSVTGFSIGGYVEKNADIQISGLTPKGIAIPARTFKAGDLVDNTGSKINNYKLQDCSSNTCTELNYIDYQRFQALTNLGTKADSTFRLVGNRRVGDIEDGVYTFFIKQIDTAGNVSEIKTVLIERDTISPLPNNVNISQSQNTINLNIVGENNSAVTIEIFTNNSRLFTKSYSNLSGSLDFNGIYSMQCGTTYVVKTRQTDEAGNVSDETSSQITSSLCVNLVYTSDGDIDDSTSNLIIHDTPQDLMLGGTSSSIVENNPNARKLEIKSRYDSEISTLAKKLIAYKTLVKQCVDDAVKIYRNYALTANTGTRWSWRYTSFEIEHYQVDQNFAKNEYSAHKLGMEAVIVSKCPYKGNVSIANPDVQELDKYISDRLQSDFNMTDDQIFQRNREDAIGSLGKALQDNWLDIAAGVINGIVFATACGIITGASAGLLFGVCLAAGFIYFDVLWGAYRGNLSLDKIGWSAGINLLVVIFSEGLLKVPFEMLVEGVRAIWDPIKRTFIKIADIFETSFQTVARLKLTDILEIRYLQTLGDLKYYSITLGNNLRKVTSASINVVTNTVKILIETNISTAEMDAIKAAAGVGKSVVKVSVVWESILENGRYKGLEIATSNSSLRTVFDSATSSIISGINENIAQKMLSKGYKNLSDFIFLTNKNGYSIWLAQGRKGSISGEWIAGLKHLTVDRYQIENPSAVKNHLAEAIDKFSGIVYDENSYIKFIKESLEKGIYGSPVTKANGDVSVIVEYIPTGSAYKYSIVFNPNSGEIITAF